MARWIPWTIALLLIAAAAAAIYTYTVSSPYLWTAAIAKQRIQSGQIDVVLDVRTPLERQTIGAFPGAVAIPSADLEAQAARQIPDKGARILVYCNTGQRARAATDKLRALGYTDVHYIAGPHTTLL